MYQSAEPVAGERKSFAPLGEAEVRRPGRAVFLHGMWRSGTTFLWSSFRSAPGTCCFYEPLHHGLAKLTPARIERDTPEKINANRHPALSRPYFAEYAVLAERRGVQGYRRDFAYDRYSLSPRQAHPRLERYLQGLIDHAGGRGETAVLGFNRTGLRLAWLKTHFSAHNIHIDREPAAIWASYAAEMGKGNYAFFSMWLSVLEKNCAHPLFAPLVERLGLRRSGPLIFTNAKVRHRRIMEAMSQEESYFLVYYLWLACTGHALAECDLVIDTRLAGELYHVRKIAAELARLTGVQVDLDKMQAAAPRLELSSSMRGRIEHSAAALFPRASLPRTALTGRSFAALPPRTADRLSAAF